jgi:hypothetical protein
MNSLLHEWDDAYRAFVGAFDTPVERRKRNDEFAEDARVRLAKFADRFTALAEQAKPVAFAIANEQNEISALGWCDMRHHDGFQRIAQLNEGCRIVYAYTRPAPPSELLTELRGLVETLLANASEEGLTEYEAGAAAQAGLIADELAAILNKWESGR